MKAVFATPSLSGPYPQYCDALEKSIPAVIADGWNEGWALEIGNPYISWARAILARRALNADADVIVFLDHDVSWGERDLAKLLATDGDVVAGTYRFKKDSEEYMAAVYSDENMRPIVRKDGCIKAECVPAGFLKITRRAYARFTEAYPDLICTCADLYGQKGPITDLFNHGVMDGIWYGEDYAFSHRWRQLGGEIWIRPDLNITHWANVKGKYKAFPGNFHEFLLRQPGGSKAC